MTISLDWKASESFLLTCSVHSPILAFPWIHPLLSYNFCIDLRGHIFKWLCCKWRKIYRGFSNQYIFIPLVSVRKKRFLRLSSKNLLQKHSAFCNILQLSTKAHTFINQYYSFTAQTNTKGWFSYQQTKQWQHQEWITFICPCGSRGSHETPMLSNGTYNLYILLLHALTAWDRQSWLFPSLSD